MQTDRKILSTREGTLAFAVLAGLCRRACWSLPGGYKARRTRGRSRSPCWWRPAAEGQLGRPDRQEGTVPGHRLEARAGQGGRDHRSREPARKGGGGELLPAHEVVHRDLSAQARGIGHRALLDLVALEAGGLEQALLGDHVAADPLGSDSRATSTVTGCAPSSTEFRYALMNASSKPTAIRPASVAKASVPSRVDRSFRVVLSCVPLLSGS